MKLPKSALALGTTSIILLANVAFAASIAHEAVSDDFIAKQHHLLAKNILNTGLGPQSPRDITSVEGHHTRVFEAAPVHTRMNLCNIHFHKNAEHKGGEFTAYAGNGDGHGNDTGFKYSGKLTDAELAHYDKAVGGSAQGDLQPGDTIEVHYVHTTAKVMPGPTLGSCLSEAFPNPQLRVEAQVYVLVNDNSARDFVELTHLKQVNGLPQATNIPSDTGTPVQYGGSTTGPDYNEKGSPLQVSWSVRPQVAKVSISSVDAWLHNNIFDERYAKGARNLITNTDLLSQIEH